MRGTAPSSTRPNAGADILTGKMAQTHKMVDGAPQHNAREYWVRLREARSRPDVLMCVTWLEARGAVRTAKDHGMVVQALGRIGELDSACAALERMPAPDGMAFTSLISACARAGQPVRALELLDTAARRGVDGEVRACNAALHACGRAGEWGRALELLGTMHAGEHGAGAAPNAVSYNTLVGALGRAGLWPRALALVGQMRSAGVAADEMTLSVAVGAITTRGLWRRALALIEASGTFERAPGDDGGGSAATATEAAPAVPAVGNAGVTCLIVALDREGRWRRAVGLIGRLRAAGRAPDEIAVSAAISACASGSRQQIQASVRTRRI